MTWLRTPIERNIVVSDGAILLAFLLVFLLKDKHKNRWGVYLWWKRLWRRLHDRTEAETQALFGEDWLLRRRLERMKRDWDRVPDRWR